MYREYFIDAPYIGAAEDESVIQITLRLFLGQLDMFFDGCKIAGGLIFVKVRFIVTNLGGGNDAHTTLFGNSTGQSAAADSNTHTALDNGDPIQ